MHRQKHARHTLVKINDQLERAHWAFSEKKKHPKKQPPENPDALGGAGGQARPSKGPKVRADWASVRRPAEKGRRDDELCIDPDKLGGKDFSQVVQLRLGSAAPR